MNHVDSFQLEELEATACQYGGEYPNCKPKPIDAGSAGVAPTPSTDPAAPASGSGGSGSSTEPPPSYSPPDPGDDVPQDTILPNCDAPLNEKEIAWCNGYVPTGEFLTRLQGALNRMDQRGEICAALAEKARSLLATGTLRITDVDYRGWGAAAPLNGRWAIFKRVWFDQFGTDGVSLDFMVSHEMDHSLGHVEPGVTDESGHLLKPDGTTDMVNTINSRRCAGLPT